MGAEAEDGPPRGVAVAVGGVVVAVVIAFIISQGLGTPGEPEAEAGDRLAVARADGPAGLAVVIPRCEEERVTGVEVREPDGTSRWRITSRNGSIDERYVVGADEVAVGFDEEVAFGGSLPDGAVVVAGEVVRNDFVLGDETTIEPGDVPVEGALYRGDAVPEDGLADRVLERASCPGSGGGLGSWTLVLDAVGVVVVVGYVLLVITWWQGRRSAGEG